MSGMESIGGFRNGNAAEDGVQDELQQGHKTRQRADLDQVCQALTGTQEEEETLSTRKETIGLGRRSNP